MSTGSFHFSCIVSDSAHQATQKMTKMGIAHYPQKNALDRIVLIRNSFEINDHDAVETQAICKFSGNYWHRSFSCPVMSAFANTTGSPRLLRGKGPEGTTGGSEGTGEAITSKGVGMESRTKRARESRTPYRKFYTSSASALCNPVMGTQWFQ